LDLPQQPDECILAQFYVVINPPHEAYGRRRESEGGVECCDLASIRSDHCGDVTVVKGEEGATMRLS